MYYALPLVTAQPIVLTEKAEGVGYITMNRPKAHNALNVELRRGLMLALRKFEDDKDVQCMVIKGAGKSFAAGADIKEMHGRSYEEITESNFFSEFDDFEKIKKPVIAAVHGYAFGGGAELAMLCDIIIAAWNALFALPEIKIGTHPGIGGTLRLPRAVGKSKAMEWILTGEPFDAQTAFKAGLVARVVPDDDLNKEVEVLAQRIAAMSLPNTKRIKQCINLASEPSAEQILAERRSFYSTWGLKDRFEGMDAFINKREPIWNHE
ncbi:MAG: enoyl-CoA hydratase/isomerase family protein [Verrucomicrobia bacterium]|nr:enoyl-CoA hydratase/isomerase family protein [Verrucomicrobiota bacterium]